MNTPPSPNDQNLRNLLRSWEVELPDDPALARRVWARIESAKPRATVGWLENLARLFTRPAMALAAVALFAALGAAAGALENSQRRDAQITRLAAEYARSIDPILMTHPSDHAAHTP